jgi:hypothetical protein
MDLIELRLIGDDDRDSLTAKLRPIFGWKALALDEHFDGLFAVLAVCDRDLGGPREDQIALSQISLPSPTDNDEVQLLAGVEGQRAEDVFRP